MSFAAAHVADDPPELDILFAATKHSLATLLRTHAPDLAICTGFPWLIPRRRSTCPVSASSTAIPRCCRVTAGRIRSPGQSDGEKEIGMTYQVMDAAFDTGNVLAQAPIPLDDDESEETLFERFPAVVAELLPIEFERLAAGDRGDPQEGGEYQSMFEQEYWSIDPSQPAAEVHRQVRAWSFVPPVAAQHGPVLEREGERIRVTRSSLTEVDGATVLECGDGPLWSVESEPAKPVPPDTAFR
jgi:methionyl-tRNA formyltransferase